MNMNVRAYDLVPLGTCLLLSEHLVHFGGDIGEAKSCHAKPSDGNDLRLKGGCRRLNLTGPKVYES